MNPPRSPRSSKRRRTRWATSPSSTSRIASSASAELNRQVNRAANGLAGLGVKPGVGVSIMMPNSPEWLFVYFATQKLGAYAVPVNVGLKGEGLATHHRPLRFVGPGLPPRLRRGDPGDPRLALEARADRREHRGGAGGMEAAGGLADARRGDGGVRREPRGGDRRRGDLRAHVHLGNDRRAQGCDQPLQGHEHRRDSHVRCDARSPTTCSTAACRSSTPTRSS